MPFRDDRRLGGPRNNEVTLNGTHDGGNEVPAEGTLLRTETQVGHPDYAFALINTTGFNAYADVNVYADGLGGEVYDWPNSFNFAYVPAGTFAATDGLLVEYPDSYAYPYGSETRDSLAILYYYHNGDGAFYTTWEGITKKPAGSLVFVASETLPMPPDVCSDENGQPVNCTYYTGRLFNVYWDGNGGTYDGPIYGSYLPNGSVYYQQSYTDSNHILQLEVSLDTGSSFGNGITTTAKWKWNGSGGQGVTEYVTSGAFYPANTPIGYDSNTGLYYYWDGVGGFFTSQYPPAGEVISSEIYPNEVVYNYVSITNGTNTLTLTSTGPSSGPESVITFNVEPEGTILYSFPPEDIVVTDQISFAVGTSQQVVYSNGENAEMSYYVETLTEYVPAGSTLGSWTYYDEGAGTDVTVTYYSNGDGTYYTS